MESQKFEFFSKKFEIEFFTCAGELKSPWLHQYQIISPAFVIDTSMERSLQVLQPGNPKMLIS